MKPTSLAGIRVLDLTNVLAGPFCCHQLVHFGAEVIKVEAVGRGDLARSLGADQALNEAQMGTSFLAQNAGKQSLTLNLKKPQGKDIFLRLLNTSDVVVENFRPGVMKRLGLDYDTLKTTKPDLIYCAISGFGQTGPLSHRVAYDQIIQGLSGVMSITGQPDGDPMRVGYPLADTIGGLTAAMSITAALNQRPRGALLDVSMLDSVLTTMGWAISNYLIGGVVPSQQGNENITSAPSGSFQTADGLLNIAANEEKQWHALITHLGCTALKDDARFATRVARKQHRKLLKQALEQYLITKSAAQWEEELVALGIPAGVIATVPEALTHPHTQTRELLGRFAIAATQQPIEIVRTGIHIDGQPTCVTTPPPTLGQDTHHLLSELGFDEQTIMLLHQQGVV